MPPDPYGRKRRRTKEPLDESERGESKNWLKTQHSKIQIMASGPIASWQIDGETMETVYRLYFLGLQNPCGKGRHPVCAAEGCGPQVRELGLRGAGNHVVRPLLAQPGGRRKASPLGSRP